VSEQAIGIDGSVAVTPEVSLFNPALSQPRQKKLTRRPGQDRQQQHGAADACGPGDE
jgi:hypothetical protein